MAAKHLSSTVLLIFILSQVISTIKADYNDDPVYVSGGSCSGAGSSLAEGCSLSDDCSTITCNLRLDKEEITFKLQVNKCESPISATASVNVPDLGITWSHTYTSNDIVQVPGFTASFPSVLSAGLYVQVDLSDDGFNVNMKVKLLLGGEVFGKGVYPIKVTVLDGDLPISTDDCGIFGWWLDLSTVLKVLVIIGPIIFLVAVITSCCCCCGCCRGCCGPSPQARGTVITRPVLPVTMATGVKSTVPMRPLVEEA